MRITFNDGLCKIRQKTKPVDLECSLFPYLLAYLVVGEGGEGVEKFH